MVWGGRRRPKPLRPLFILLMVISAIAPSPTISTGIPVGQRKFASPVGSRLSSLPSSTIVPFDHGGAPPDVSGHLSLRSGPWATNFLTNLDSNLMLQLKIDPSLIHSSLQFASLSFLKKLWPLLNDKIGESPVSYHLWSRAALLRHELDVIFQVLLSSELCNILITSADLQGTTMVVVRLVVTHLIWRVGLWQGDRLVMLGFRLYGVRTYDGSMAMGTLFPNPNSLSIILVGLFGPYYYYGYWALKVEPILNGLSYLIIFQGVLINLARELLLEFIAGVNFTSLPIIHFSVWESPTFSPLFKRAFLSVRVISVQRLLLHYGVFNARPIRY